MTVCGYGRVSRGRDGGTDTLHYQRLRLTGADGDAAHIHQDIITGTVMQGPGLNSLLEVIRAGDVLVVTALDPAASHSQTDGAVGDRPTHRTTEDPRRLAPVRSGMVSYCILSRQFRPAPPPWSAIGAPNDNRRPPRAPFIGIEPGPSRSLPLSPCSNAKAVPRWIRGKAIRCANRQKWLALNTRVRLQPAKRWPLGCGSRWNPLPRSGALQDHGCHDDWDCSLSQFAWAVHRDAAERRNS